jgi:hypothetical protein
VELGQELRLARQVRGERRARRDRRTERLDGDVPSERLLYRVVHVGERPRSYLLDHATVAENLDDARHGARL